VVTVNISSRKNNEELASESLERVMKAQIKLR
jgi:hypothetical protein